MREAELERWIRLKIQQIGGLCVKFISPSLRGVPDRLVLLPGGKTLFIEVKRKGEKPRPEQLKVHKQFRDLGAAVFVVDSKERLDAVLKSVK